MIKKGEPILVCENVDEQNQLLSLKKEIAVIEARMQYEYVSHPEKYQVDAPLLQARKRELADEQERVDNLVVRAPVDGLLIAPDIAHNLHRFFQKGEDLGITVAGVNDCVAKGFLDERDMALPFLIPSANQQPDKAEIRLAGAPGIELSGSVAVWGPAGVIKLDPDLLSLTLQGGGELSVNPKDPNGATLEKPEFPVLVSVDFASAKNPGQRFYPGQKAYLRFDLGKKPLIWQWYRRLGQLMQTHSSTNKWL
jgi:putative peptide zinc metalloprotease protein